MLRRAHQVAATGFQLQAGSYAKARPSYPPAALERIKQILPAKKKALDLAAGTGKMTKLLDQAGYEVTAVEPVENMRQKLAKDLPHINTLEGTSWRIPVSPESQDAVMMAQAFHWFDDIETLREVHRVLKPNGLVFMIWNKESRERSPMIAQLRDYYEVHEGNTPQYRKGTWKNVFELPEAGKLFNLPMNHAFYTNDLYLAREDIWPRIHSLSFVAVLPQDKKDQLRQQIEAVLDDPNFGHAKDEQGRFFFPHDTNMYWFQKR
ncbi:S-adenosyl-L-methionine-dependent methyltransferase [Radiomyces spectabilis]|uniref:S-adenosyl-L-methionine-dependent methyltransferase n=1 Tax=Radiomyces spectabilis TaxID=64574 RepID=UPI00222053A6|nr:S-adenosyl-L-methionine-dependent methyltransferase [Radiomyces spectabilis]KAI8379679.1 S-adenosyl-L-methionine-dependent methyltransferase [Radiomyces spectabilis]